VLLEVDSMTGTPRLEDTQTLRGVSVSLAGIYSEAQIALDVRRDEDNLPRLDSVRLADLHGLMTTFDTVTAPAGVWKVHALIVTRDADDPDTLGIMFDFGESDLNDAPREGFGVFASAHESLPAGVAPELLLTTAHEMAHCFNLHHPDWEGTAFSHDATVESYSLTDTVRWALSSQSKEHLLHHHRRLVEPGPLGLPFGLETRAHLDAHKSDPPESFVAVDPGDLDAARRGTVPPRATAARASLARTAAGAEAREDSGLRLHLHSPKQAYVLGEPVVMTVGVHNDGTTSRMVIPSLNPYNRFLNVEVQAPGSGDFLPFRPAVLADARGKPAVELGPGESLHEEVRIFFGADGWTFRKAGIYSVRADYPSGVGPDAGRIRSEVVRVEIREPASEADTAAERLVMGTGDERATEQGVFLLLDGGDHLKRGAGSLRRIAEQFPSAAQAPAARLALGLSSLSPTVDPSRRTRPGPRLEEAQRYLSGILDANLPASSVLKAQMALVNELEKRGDRARARTILQQTVRKFEGLESAKTAVEAFKRKLGPGA